MPNKYYVGSYFTVKLKDNYYIRVAALNHRGLKKYNASYYVDKLHKVGSNKIIKSKREIKDKIQKAGLDSNLFYVG